MSPANPKRERTSVLFVCLGNICRSPLAEGIFVGLVKDAGLEEVFTIDSAGTGSWHVGSPPDARSVQVAAQHGLTLECAARQVSPSDFQDFDHIVAMDRSNLRDLEGMAQLDGSKAELSLLRSRDPMGGFDVPDPYYGGANGFERVYRMIERCCQELLLDLRG